MQRLIIEVDALEFAKLASDNSIDRIKTLEVLHFIRQDKDEIILICSVEFKDRSTNLEGFFNEEGSEFQVLDHDKKGKYVILLKSKPQNDPAGEFLASEFWAKGGYMLAPLEIKEGKLKMSFLGGAKQMRTIPILLKRARIRYRIVKLTDANLSPTSPMSELTEKQRGVITTAFNLGYYDLPRKISSRQLAAKLKIGDSDFIKHRRKAERRLLSSIVNA